MVSIRFRRSSGSMVRAACVSVVMLCELYMSFLVQGILNGKGDRGYSGFDLRHNLVAQDICELPFDHRWGLEGWRRADTKVQLFIFQVSVLMTRVHRIQSESSRPGMGEGT